MPKSKEFISSEEDSGSGSDEPKPKKKKVEKPKETSDASGSESDEPKPKKKTNEKPKEKPEKQTSKAKPKGDKGPNGEYMFQIANMRFATVSEFRGKVMVGIREFYNADGEMRPGKKGISLPMDQWKRLKDQIEDIDAAVKQMS
ncbi:activated RNA polymerase II transcriptional coactivator p15-like [Dreissena polymorpha]|uniref:Transcriptional coactivator p15 (PC4) C-terminal domain-containing protein n=1 Tax=Dreissena polymorpha TaxID=45954 RepID=A0A9D4DBH5_DREPO|nr:activated RNA polymerase II transcriptional coactivator p15-like [Dreissena polymorpha]XP_052240002.1 activated RNA polymerase II transcriptional coactivator p15-like [Dreissena polymorpha]XP_052240003.1 activated RNA polymerase II transcriptional coactivator p15-like [Dreissena polymorpha]KAH3741649.1 hypothetical protein DPMN_048374 [Dreissena polymorpha]